VEVGLSGSAGALDEIKTALMGDGTFIGTITSSLFLALLAVYLLMAVLFQSWSYPLVIMVSVPLATFGGFLGLSIVHNWSVLDRYTPVQNMDVLTILGFVILAGVVVNNAILIVHQTLNFLGEGDNPNEKDVSMTPRDAIAESVRTRVRPIMMSTLTSVGGMLPLVLMPGSGSELYRGLGSVVVGGLLVSTVFTLVLVPIVLSLLFNIREKLRSMRGSLSMESNEEPTLAK
jgi:HAE1 family hydrophobic/amphiphilic exporter-1